MSLNSVLQIYEITILSMQTSLLAGETSRNKGKLIDKSLKQLQIKCKTTAKLHKIKGIISLEFSP